MNVRCWVSLSLALLVGGVCRAQVPLEEMPGYFPLDEVGLFTSEELSVEVNLTGPILKLVGAAVASEDEEFAGLVSGLEAITVRVAPSSGVDLGEVRQRITAASKRLEDAGWMTIVRPRDEGEEVRIYAREVASEIVGLTVLALDDDSDGDVAVINIVGPIDPARLQGIGKMLDLSKLEEIGGEYGD